VAAGFESRRIGRESRMRKAITVVLASFILLFSCRPISSTFPHAAPTHSSFPSVATMAEESIEGEAESDVGGDNSSQTPR
jgi:hypothetical protein